MLDGAGADSIQRAGKRHKVSKHVVQHQQVQQQQGGGWQSEDSGSDSGSSDGEGGADRSKDGNDSDEDDLHWPLSIIETSASLRYLQIQLLITVLRYSRIDFALIVKYVIILARIQGYYWSRLSRSLISDPTVSIFFIRIVTGCLCVFQHRCTLTNDPKSIERRSCVIQLRNMFSSFLYIVCKSNSVRIRKKEKHLLSNQNRKVEWGLF